MLLLFLFLSFCCGVAYSAEPEECYRGNITLDGEHFTGATVLIKDSTDLVLGFGVANQDGAYSICGIEYH